MSSWHLIAFFAALIAGTITIPLTFADEPILSPKAQLESGVAPEEILCKENRILVIRDNGSPACVSQNTAQKMNWEIVTKRITAPDLENIMVPLLKNQTNNGVDEPLLQNKDKKDTETVVEQNNTQARPATETSTDDQTHKTRYVPIAPQDLTGLIPHDVTFDSVLKMPPEDPDELAQKLVEYTGDSITSKREDDHKIRYDTELGYISISNYPSTAKTPLLYRMYEYDLGNQQQTDEFTYGLLDILGVTVDDGDSVRNNSNHMTTGKWIIQKKGDMLVLNNQIEIESSLNSVSIRLGGWNDNLDEMNLIDIDTAKQAAKKDLATSEELYGPKCDILENMNSTYFGKKNLYIIDGRPIYSFFYGGCQIPSNPPGHSPMYDAYVDAITGQTLFVGIKGIF